MKIVVVFFIVGRYIMKKSILVIDTPEDCRECPVRNGGYSQWCGGYGDTLISSYPVKSDWCTLISLPEKYETDKSKCSDPFYEFEFEYGYNQCIDEILCGKYET